MCTSIVNKSPHRLKRYNFESGGEGWNIKYYSLLPMEMPQHLFLVLFYDEQSAAEATMRAQPPGSLFLPTQDANVASLIKFSDDQTCVLLRYCNQCHDYNPRAACCVNGRTCQRRKTQKPEEIDTSQTKKRKPRSDGAADDKRPRAMTYEPLDEPQIGFDAEFPPDVYEDMSAFDSTDGTPYTDRSGTTTPEHMRSATTTPDRMRATSESSGLGSFFYPSPERLPDIPEFKEMDLGGNLMVPDKPESVPGPFGFMSREFSPGLSDPLYLDNTPDLQDPMLVSVPTWEFTKEYIENQMKSNTDKMQVLTISEKKPMSTKDHASVCSSSSKSSSSSSDAGVGESCRIVIDSSSSDSSSSSSNSSSNSSSSSSSSTSSSSSRSGKLISRKSSQRSSAEVEETGEGHFLHENAPPAVAVLVSTAEEDAAEVPVAKILTSPMTYIIRPLMRRLSSASPPPFAARQALRSSNDLTAPLCPSPPPPSGVVTPSFDVSLAVFFWVFGGILGAHHLYLRRKGWALLYMCTLGLLGMGWLFDLSRICKLVKDANQQYVLSSYGSVAPSVGTVQAFSTAEAYLLWMPPFGILGMHHFYLRRYSLGVLYVFTLGLLGVGWVVDGTRLNQLVARANKFDRLAAEHTASGKPRATCPDPWLEKDAGLTLSLWIPPWGLLGCHLYYLGLFQRALLYTFTLALAGYGWFHDRRNLEQLTRERNKALVQDHDVALDT